MMNEAYAQGRLMAWQRQSRETDELVPKYDVPDVAGQVRCRVHSLSRIGLV